jgi:hypothetical protein
VLALAESGDVNLPTPQCLGAIEQLKRRAADNNKQKFPLVNIWAHFDVQILSPSPL